LKRYSGMAKEWDGGTGGLGEWSGRGAGGVVARGAVSGIDMASGRCMRRRDGKQFGMKRMLESIVYGGRGMVAKGWGIGRSEDCLPSDIYREVIEDRDTAPLPRLSKEMRLCSSTHGSLRSVPTLYAGI
jgi:hypothetical protein